MLFWLGAGADGGGAVVLAMVVVVVMLGVVVVEGLVDLFPPTARGDCAQREVDNS